MLRKARLSPYLLSLLVFILFVSVLYGEDFMCMLGQQLQLDSDPGALVPRTGESNPAGLTAWP